MLSNGIDAIFGTCIFILSGHFHHWCVSVSETKNPPSHALRGPGEGELAAI